MKKNVYATAVNTRAKKETTPQSMAIPGREADMARNSAGGFSFVLDEFAVLDRFLILGSESNTYYASAQKLTEKNAKNVLAAIAKNGVRVVNRIVEISDSGRAPKNDPALLALALCMTKGDPATKKAAYDALPKVARTGTHLFHLAEYVNGTRGWGRGIRRAFGQWYNGRTPMKLAEQMTKYANRDGWTHADILRLAHVKPVTSTHDALFANALGTAKPVEIDADVAEYMAAVDEIKATRDPKVAATLITAHRLPREVVPTELLNDKRVWEALLPHMGITALVRNLATLTRVGIIAPNGDGTREVIAKMADTEMVQKSRIHPLQVLMALMTYKAGRGLRGSNTWMPNGRVVDALDDMFYAAFQNVEPTGKRHVLALDISGSMGMYEIAGYLGLTPRIASAALAMVTMRVEKEWEIVGFSHNLIRLPLTAKMTLAEVVQKVDRLPFGGTDCSLPMQWAMKNKVPAEAFCVYTDNETWFGSVHPSQALKKYRSAMGLPAKMVVNGMTATNFTIADPKDGGMLDVVGFDTAAPALMADFIRG